MKRKMTIQITVTVPAATGENEVAEAINAALDEAEGRDWGEWEVGPAIITNVIKEITHA